MQIKSRYVLTVMERDDGALVWSAMCSACNENLFGELHSSVYVIEVPEGTSQSEYMKFMEQVKVAWDNAVKNGRPICQLGVTMKQFNSSGMQHALESHIACCPATARKS